jgi:hypothetical protein
VDIKVITGKAEQKVGSTVRYKCRFAQQLATGETIQSATAAAAPSGPTVSATVSGTDVLVSVAGVVAGATHRVTVTPTTTGVTPTQVLPISFDVTGVA